MTARAAVPGPISDSPVAEALGPPSEAVLTLSAIVFTSRTEGKAAQPLVMSPIDARAAVLIRQPEYIVLMLSLHMPSNEARARTRSRLAPSALNVDLNLQFFTVEVDGDFPAAPGEGIDVGRVGPTGRIPPPPARSVFARRQARRSSWPAMAAQTHQSSPRRGVHKLRVPPTGGLEPQESSSSHQSIDAHLGDDTKSSNMTEEFGRSRWGQIELETLALQYKVGQMLGVRR